MFVITPSLAEASFRLNSAVMKHKNEAPVPSPFPGSGTRHQSMELLFKISLILRLFLSVVVHLERSLELHYVKCRSKSNPCSRDRRKGSATSSSGSDRKLGEGGSFNFSSRKGRARDVL